MDIYTVILYCNKYSDAFLGIFWLVYRCCYYNDLDYCNAKMHFILMGTSLFGHYHVVTRQPRACVLIFVS